MQVCYLGPLTVRVDGQERALGGPKQRLVLANLLLELGRTVTTQQLIEAVWGAEPPASARNTLQTYVSHLRRVVGPAQLVSHRHGYALVVPADAVDGPAFEGLATRGRSLLGQDPAAAAEVLRAAIELWRGTPFADLDGATSLQPAVVRLEERRQVVEEDRVAADIALGRGAEVVGELEALTAAHPLRERSWELLLLALHSCGRPADALAAFRRARYVLAEEAGIDPSDRLRRLHERILAQDPGLDAAWSDHGRRAPGWGRHPTGPDFVEPPRRARVPFPTALPPQVGSRYVGRDELLAQLWSHWTTATSGGRSHAVLLSGEPGIGKTRTVTELARRAYDAGALVLAGRSEEGLAVPYQPLVEVLDWQVQHDPSLPLGRLPGELTRLHRALATAVPDLPPPVRSDPRAEEHRLYTAVGSWIAAVSQPNGLLLVLDDLQWATEPTLRLLVHVLHSIAADPSAAVLVLGAYRDTDVDGQHPLVGVMAELRRSSEEASCRAVDPLAERAVGEMVGDLLDRTPEDVPSEVSARVLAETEGNPFFVRELLRHWAEGGAVHVDDGQVQVDDCSTAGIPEGVRDVVRQRLHRLGPEAIEVLRVTAVLGQGAEVAVLARLVAGGVEQVLAGFEEALHAGLVEEAEPDRFRLTHALVGQALIAELSAPRRRRLHLRIVEALQALRPGGVVALARHALAALPAEGAQEPAVRYAVAAGEQALAQRAPEDAEQWFGRACELADGLSSLEAELELRARCGLGEAQRDRGDQGYRQTLLDAARAALSTDRVDLAARAAIANHRATTVSTIGTVDRDRVDVLEAMCDRLGTVGDDADLQDARVRVRALLALELTFDDTQRERRLQLVDQALEFASEAGDPELQAWVTTVGRIPMTVPERIPQVARLLHSAVSQADAIGDPVLRCASRVSAHQALLGVGDVARARELAIAAVELADAEGVPFLQVLARFNAVQYRAYEGDLAGARAQNRANLEFSQAVGETDTVSWWGAIEGSLAIIDGTLPHLVPALAEFADSTPDLPAWRAAHAAALAVGGWHEEATAVVDRYELRRPQTVRNDFITTTAWTHLAVAAYELADAGLGAMLVERLTPHREHWAHVNVFCQGPLEVHLGLALGAIGRFGDACEAVRRGRELLIARGFRSHVPWATGYLARLLLDRGAPGDAEEARSLAEVARADADAMGLPAMSARLEGLSASAA